MKERTIVQGITRAVKRAGGVAIKVHGSPYQQAGLPDLVVVIDGMVSFLEVKTPTGRVSRVQSLCHDRLRQAGGRVYVVRSVEEALCVMIPAETWRP